MSLRGRIYRRSPYVRAFWEYFQWDGKPKRAPKAGEYFLSGAIPEVYRAENDLETMEYHIMVPYEPAPGELIHDGHIYVRKGER